MSHMVKVLTVPSLFRRKKYLVVPANVRCRVLTGGTQIVRLPGMMTMVPIGGLSGDSVGGAACGTAACLRVVHISSLALLIGT